MASLMIGVGEVDIGQATIAGKRYVRVRMTDTDSPDFVDLTFGLDHFVAVADHLRMVADEIIKANTRNP